MEEIKNLPLPMGLISKYTLRKTREKVEIIAFSVKEEGTRNEEDWVTYIDSEGNEHIKEHLNIQLDFAPGDTFSELYERFAKPFNEDFKFPSVENTRIFETAKTLIAHKYYSIDDAITVAKELVTKVKDLEV